LAGSDGIARVLGDHRPLASFNIKDYAGAVLPRELGGAVVERTLEDGHYVYRKTWWIMPADTSI
jgi:hypothetical protein